METTSRKYYWSSIHEVLPRRVFQEEKVQRKSPEREEKKRETEKSWAKWLDQVQRYYQTPRVDMVKNSWKGKNIPGKSCLKKRTENGGTPLEKEEIGIQIEMELSEYSLRLILEMDYLNLLRGGDLYNKKIKMLKEVLQYSDLLGKKAMENECKEVKARIVNLQNKFECQMKLEDLEKCEEVMGKIYIGLNENDESSDLRKKKLESMAANNKISKETQGVNEVNVDINIFGELSEDDSDYENYDVNMVRPRFISKKERKLGCSNTEMEEKKEVGTMNQNGILESRQIGEKSETEGRFQEKEGNQLKRRKSWEIHNTKEGNEEVGEKVREYYVNPGRRENNLEKYNLENDEEKMEKHDLGKEQRWEIEILAEDFLDIPARTEVLLMGRLKKKICGKILVCEFEKMGNAHFLAAKSVVRNGESVPIRLINLSQGQVKVQRNQKIALATGCVEEEETEKESLRFQGVSLSDDKWIAEGFQMDYLTENISKKLKDHYYDIEYEEYEKYLKTHQPPKAQNFKIKQGDLFSAPESYALAHCVSQDFAMGKGIAARFKQLFGSVNTLMEQKKMVGEVAELRLSEKNVYYMVTEFRYYEKPSYRSVWNALRNLKKNAKRIKINI
ncbi:hypothetical protein JTB14_027613 [Gonioctena quinquepunctata]|nr:hypothetical protein JTB14_027613 [Gonioctena quinquepunctata]